MKPCGKDHKSTTFKFLSHERKFTRPRIIETLGTDEPPPLSSGGPGSSILAATEPRLYDDACLIAGLVGRICGRMAARVPAREAGSMLKGNKNRP